ncbi:alpha/beta hydrolase [Ilumatobacter sp.]|uniref:alpha/beta hydrolase n=1 Tax=Ilumatobacter sp. TaxID=1967498 RepID=UPI003B51BB0D
MDELQPGGLLESDAVVEGDPDPTARPLWTEFAAVPESVLGTPAMALAAALAPTGSSRPVLVLPGFTTGDVSTLPLRAFLRALGHRPYGWGLGINVGVADHIAVGLDRSLRELAHRYGTTIDIVGWSAGGMLGRMLAQNRGELVGQVISLGSPIRLRSSDHNLGLISRIAGHLFVPTAPHIDVDTVPVPSTTIWTARDGVVPGLACKQTIRPGAEAIEVRGTHCGLGTNPAVAYAVADRLAQGEPWTPFDPPRRARWWFGEIENGDA